MAVADTTGFDNVWDVAVLDVIKTAIALFFNGIYMLLVIFAIYFLRRRRPVGHRILICAIGVMFIFAMTEMALQIVTATLSMKSLYSAAHGDRALFSGPLQRISRILGFVENLLLITNNTVTDSFLIYRCYVIWGTSSYKKKVVILPLLLLLCTTVVAYVTVYRNDLAPPKGPP
ncbi:hypothetical protein FB451DRAFT_702152 [Mycena latifolia]|nr:hypothetical protein FB451DRAFT_702152 [Mycena latifolia]